jgi:nicotinamidase-related amidase
LRRALDPARATLAAARTTGMHVVHTREGYAADLSDLNPFRRISDPFIGGVGPNGRFLIRGELGNQIVPEMAPLAGELVLDKAGFSAFFRTGLSETLGRNSITHLILMGVTTQCCVASTLRNAVDEGYFCLLLEDCCAAFDPADHDASIRVIYAENNNFGWVSDSARFAAALAGRPTASASGQ